MHAQIKAAMEMALEEGTNVQDSMRIMVEYAAGFDDFDCTGLEEAIAKIFTHWSSKSKVDTTQFRIRRIGTLEFLSWETVGGQRLDHFFETEELASRFLVSRDLSPELYEII